jgi:hypothetical protein
MTYDDFRQNFLKEFLKIKSFAGRKKFADQQLGKPIGSGSGRIVYNIDDEKVLKLAKNQKGIGQNVEESGIGRDNYYQDIVTIVYESDDDDNWLVSEKAKKVNEKRIIQLTGIPNLNDFRLYVTNEISENNGRKPIYRLDDNSKAILDENDFTDVVKSLMLDYNQNPGDLSRPSTYGEVLRNGQPSIVLTDYGLSEDVYTTHYSPERNQFHKMYEMYNFADGNDDILSDIGNTGEIRQGMWGLKPYDVGDGPGVINEDFISFVLNRDKYPTRKLPSAPYLIDEFHECVNNLDEILNKVNDKKKFYNNLLELQDYLIRSKFFDREPLLKESIGLNEAGQFSLEELDVEYVNKIAKVVTEKLNLGEVMHLGGGGYGQAYLLNNNRVLKITTDACEVDAAGKTMGSGAKTLINVYKVYKIIDTTENKMAYALIEDYIPHKPYKDFTKYIDNIADISDSLYNNLIRISSGKKSKDEFADKTFDDFPEIAKLILTENPSANKSAIDRQNAYKFMLGIFEIKKELISLNIKSNDFLNVKNLGYNNGILTFFDIGGCRVEEPDVPDSDVIRLPEEQNINQLTEIIGITNGFNRALADRIANQMGFGQPKYIGEGTFGFAYDIGNNRVLKITSDKSEAVENLELKGKPLKYIAVPYNIYKIKSKNDPNIPETYGIVLEKLKTDPVKFTRLKDRLEFAFEKILDLSFGDVFDYYLHGYPEVDEDKLQKYLNKNPEDNEYFLALLNIAEELKKYGSESMDFVNPNNLGYKPDGNIGFFDVDFGNFFAKSSEEPEEMEVDEDGSALYSTDNAIGQDNFPSYETNDTSPSIQNDLNANSAIYSEDFEYTHVDDAIKDEFMLGERKLSSMPGSSTVDVKKKCKLGGLGNTSAACNQGDIKNLDIKPMNETIDASEAHSGLNTFQTMVDGRKDVGLITIKYNEHLLELIEKNNFKIIPIKQKDHNIGMTIVYTSTPKGEANAKRLEQIMISHNGYVADKTPQEAYEIGRLLDYSDESIKKYIKRIYYRTPNGEVMRRNHQQLNQYDNEHPELREDVADKYGEKLGLKSEFGDFEKKFSAQQSKESDDDSVITGETSDAIIVLYKNPKSFKDIDVSARGVIDKDGNLYISHDDTLIHDDILMFLHQKNILIYNPNWFNELPTDYVTIQRYFMTNTILLGESNLSMIANKLRTIQNKAPLREVAKPYYQKFIDAANHKNPQYKFINESIRYYGHNKQFYDVADLDENTTFANMNEVEQGHNKYYRAVSKYMGEEVEFEPNGYYEAIGDDGYPIMKYDTFWMSKTPEIAASKSIGGAVMGIYSMMKHHNSIEKYTYIYEINEKPDVDISHWTYGDFEYLEEVRYRKPVKGKYFGKVAISDDMKKKFDAFYELQSLEAYDEPDDETLEIAQNTDYNKYLKDVNNMIHESMNEVEIIMENISEAKLMMKII